jgi:phage shock protein E
MSPRVFILACVITGAAAAAFGAGNDASAPGAAPAQVTPGRLAEMLRDKDFFFVNTHIPYEGEIEGTDAFIPYDETASRIREYPADKSATIVVYCRSGRMSEIAARELAKAGFTHVIDLSGGMVAWEDAGFTIFRNKARR